MSLFLFYCPACGREGGKERWCLGEKEEQKPRERVKDGEETDVKIGLDERRKDARELGRKGLQRGEKVGGWGHGIVVSDVVKGDPEPCSQSDSC